MRKNASARAGVIAVTALTLALSLGAAGCSSTGSDAPSSDGASAPAVSASDAPSPDPALDGDAAKDSSGEGTAGDVETFGTLGEVWGGTVSGEEYGVDAAADVTAVYVWSTTCPACIDKMPALAGLAQSLPGNVRVATLCLDGLANADRVQGILDKAGFTGETLVSASEETIAMLRHVVYTPTTMFVSSDGTVVGHPLVGAVADFEQRFLDGVNTVLAWEGKDPVALKADA